MSTKSKPPLAGRDYIHVLAQCTDRPHPLTYRSTLAGQVWMSMLMTFNELIDCGVSIVSRSSSQAKSIEFYSSTLTGMHN